MKYTIYYQFSHFKRNYSKNGYHIIYFWVLLKGGIPVLSGDVSEFKVSSTIFANREKARIGRAAAHREDYIKDRETIIKRFRIAQKLHAERKDKSYVR